MLAQVAKFWGKAPSDYLGGPICHWELDHACAVLLLERMGRDGGEPPPSGPKEW
jgi:hypothetical protein